MAKKIKMPRKAEKQFKELNARFKITRREFLDYYNAVRKANRKLGSKSYKDKLFMSKKFSLNVGHIKNRGLFVIHRRKVKETLKKDFVSQVNRKVRENTYNNLLNLLAGNASDVISKLESLTDRQFDKFFKDNPDLNFLKYDSLTDVGDFLDITLENIISRF